jgi:hypothetical protein
MIVADADPEDDAPPDDLAFLNTTGASSCAVWNQDLIYVVPETVLSRLGGRAPFFTRTSTTDDGDRHEDECVVHIGIVGTDASFEDQVVGYCFVNYVVELDTPHLPSDGAAEVYVASYSGTDIKVSWNSSDVAVVKYGTLVNDGKISVTNNEIQFLSSGWYIIDMMVTGTAAAATTPVDTNWSPSWTSTTAGTTSRSMYMVNPAYVDHSEYDPITTSFNLNSPAWGTVTRVDLKVIKMLPLSVNGDRDILGVKRRPFPVPSFFSAASSGEDDSPIRSSEKASSSSMVAVSSPVMPGSGAASRLGKPARH